MLGTFFKGFSNLLACGGNFIRIKIYKEATESVALTTWFIS